MFYEISGELFREVLMKEGGAWLISYENPTAPKYVSKNELRRYQKIEPPEQYLIDIDRNLEKTDGQTKREGLIAPLLEDVIYITDKTARLELAKKIAAESNTTVKRVQTLFYRSLAGRPLVEKRKEKESLNKDEQKNFSWAINTYYFSAKKMSLKTTYDLLLLSKYTDADGNIKEKHPSWNSFRHYFYRNNYHKKSAKSISRDGLSDYQRNRKPLFNSASSWKNEIGTFQMDATQADIYLVSRLDKSAVIGRPYIYMAVDTATQLITGIYVGLDAGEQAVINCLANAAMDKVRFCKRYGIEIIQDKWPNIGLPREIITDKGREFIGSRMDELCLKYGMEFESLPPFRPDRKGLVEKMFDLLQQKYKPLLRGKGAIEADAAERWAVDYRSQAVLNLDEFTTIVLHCVVYLNSSRILDADVVEREERFLTAAELWKWYESENRSAIIPISEEQLYKFRLPRKKAILARKGINNQGLWYVSDKYKSILENRRIGEKVQIAYDPENVSAIFLVDGIKYLCFTLADYCKQYAGINHIEYELKRKSQEEGKRELDEADTRNRVQLIKDIQSVIEQAAPVNKAKIDSKVIHENRERESD